MNREIQYKKYRPDYSGMILNEVTFAVMRDYENHEREYKLDIITSEKMEDNKYPAVFFVHGGGFMEPCDKRQAYISLFARKLTERGYILISPDYPIYETEEKLNQAGGESAGYLKAAEAVHYAYRYIKEHAEEYHIDAKRIAMMGGSAGSMCAFYAIAGYDDDYNAFINLWGVPKPLPDIRKFPPVLSIHGTADVLVAYERELILKKKLDAAGIKNQLITLEGEGHTPLGQLEAFFSAILKVLDKYTF